MPVPVVFIVSGEMGYGVYRGVFVLYFSEQENGMAPRTSHEIGDKVWRGIRSLIQARVEDGSFGARYPESCFESPMAIGTDRLAFRDAMRAHIPGLKDWPWREQEERPTTLSIMDMVQFCWNCIGKPIPVDYHEYGKHNHLRFDIEDGREQFCADVEDIFRRNGIAYKFTSHGRIERVAPRVLQDILTHADFRTGDSKLDELLNSACRKFLDPVPETRKEGLDALWDAWERLKSLGGDDKKTQTRAMLDIAAGNRSPRFRDALDSEAKELTSIGNSLHIRHAETNQEVLAEREHVDYLFHRLFSLVNLIVRMKH